MTRTLPAMVAALALACGHAALAAEPAPPQNVLSMAASATQEVTQDLLVIVLATSRDGSDAATVQAQLRQALDAALAEARKAARPGQVDVRTGNFSLQPRYTPKGQINGWQGSAELVLEGRDLPALAQLAGRLHSLSIARVAYGLSRETREKVEAEVAAQAIARFRARAGEYARQFGFAGYTVREVNVGTSDAAMPVPMMRARAMASASMSDEALPVEAGKSAVTVQVNGSVVMK